MTTDEQSVKAIKLILTSVFSGASDPPAQAPAFTSGSISDKMLADPMDWMILRRDELGWQSVELECSSKGTALLVITFMQILL